MVLKEVTIDFMSLYICVSIVQKKPKIAYLQVFVKFNIVLGIL